MPFDSPTAGAFGAASDHWRRPGGAAAYDYSRRFVAQLRVDNFVRPIGRLAYALFATFVAWRARARDRRLLASMDERMCRDIGISRLVVFHEISKPFWRS